MGGLPNMTCPDQFPLLLDRAQAPGFGEPNNAIAQDGPSVPAAGVDNAIEQDGPPVQVDPADVQPDPADVQPNPADVQPDPQPRGPPAYVAPRWTAAEIAAVYNEAMAYIQQTSYNFRQKFGRPLYPTDEMADWADGAWIDFEYIFGGRWPDECHEELINLLWQRLMQRSRQTDS